MTAAPEDTARAALRVTLWQHASDLDPAANLAALDRVDDLGDGADLVVLPEAFARDFGDPGSNLAPYAEPLDGPFASRLDELAEKHGLVLYPFFLEGIAGDRALNQADGLHPTAEGVNVIVRTILPTVERFIATLPARS